MSMELGSTCGISQAQTTSHSTKSSPVPAHVALTLLTFRQLTYAFYITYTFDILFTKASILLLFLRVFSLTRSLRIVIQIFLWAHILFYIASFFAAVFMCFPLDAIWNPYVRHIKCLDIGALKVVSAVINVVSDFAILFIPISTVWNLKMQRKNKVRTMAIFATGLL